MWVTRETSCLWWYLSVSYKTAVTVLLSRLVCFVCFQIATVMTPLSWLNKANLSVCPSVFSSMKSFFSDLNVIWYLGVGLWLLDDGMPYENSKVKVTEAQKLKNGRFLSVSSTSMHVIKRLTVNYRDKTVSRLCRDRFVRFFLVQRHVTCKVRLLWRVDWQTCMGLFFNFKTITR